MNTPEYPIASSQPLPPLAPAPKHSGLGVASFVISIVVGCSMLALFVVAGILHRSHEGGRYPGQEMVGFVAIGLFATDVVAIGLGIAALCQPGTKRVFGILGLVFSSATIIGTIALIIIALHYAAGYRQ